MNKKMLLLIFLIIFIFLAIYIGQNKSVNFFKRKNGRAPDFSLQDTYGKNFQLSSMKGHPLIIFFGTTWCPQCRSEMMALKSLHDKYAQRKLKLIYIDINESAERVALFAKQNSYPGIILLDLDGSVAYDYGVIGVPSIILVNAEGKIIGEGKEVSDLSFDALLPNKK
ncbi:MAG: TlpA family protein disulfide reductase [Syntrophaceae bacterium]|nr:TlpA family protein disulfide reductase [Syntrophaceae bacterium]